VPARSIKHVAPIVTPTNPAGGRAGMPWAASTAAILLVAGWLVFGLPWRIPVPEGIQSDSAAFGFNNSAATLGVAATLLVLFLRRVCVRRVAEIDAQRLRSLVVRPARATVVEQVVVAGCIALSWGIVGGWWALLPNAFFGETTYFLTRLDMMTLGHLPYRDFDFGYGPGLLWLPVIIHRAAGGLLAIDTAYILTVLLHYALGLLATASLLRRFALGSGARIAILVFVTLASLNITLGPIYAPLRFVYALWAILLFDDTQRRSPAWEGWLAGFILPLWGMLISPEVGITTVLACLTWLATAAWCGRGDLAIRATAVAGAVAAAWVAAGPGMFRSIGTFGGGALNFPLLPAPYVLSLLGVALGILPALAAAGIHGRNDASPILVSLVVASGLFLPAALGRCDPGHVLLNGLGLLLIGFAVTISARRRWAIGAMALAAAVLLVTSQWSFVNRYGELVANALDVRGVIRSHRELIDGNDRRVLEAIGADNPGFDWSKRHPFPTDLLRLPRLERIGTPLGASEDVDRFLKMSGRYQAEYHVPPFTGVVDQSAVDRKVADAAQCDLLLVPGGALAGLGPIDTQAYSVGMSATLSSLFVIPVRLTATRPPWVGDIEVVRRLLADHAPAGTFRDMVILRRRAPTPAHPSDAPP